jgi:hypothetical protein
MIMFKFVIRGGMVGGGNFVISDDCPLILGSNGKVRFIVNSGGSYLVGSNAVKPTRSKWLG